MIEQPGCGDDDAVLRILFDRRQQLTDKIAELQARLTEVSFAIHTLTNALADTKEPST